VTFAVPTYGYGVGVGYGFNRTFFGVNHGYGFATNRVFVTSHPQTVFVNARASGTAVTTAGANVAVNVQANAGRRNRTTVIRGPRGGTFVRSVNR
jgi:hypothetical protein